MQIVLKYEKILSISFFNMLEKNIHITILPINYERFRLS